MRRRKENAIARKSCSQNRREREHTCKKERGSTHALVRSNDALNARASFEAGRRGSTHALVQSNDALNAHAGFEAGRRLRSRLASFEAGQRLRIRP